MALTVDPARTRDGAGEHGPGNRPADPGRGRSLRTLATALVGTAALGPPVGLLWSALAPRAVGLAGPAGLQVADPETKAFIAADGLLFLLGLAAGLAVGAAAWRYGRRSPLAALLGVVAGSFAAAWLAARTGLLGEDREALVAAARSGAVTGRTELALQLRSTSVLLAWPGGAAAALTVLLLREPDRRPERPRRRLSWG